MTGMSSRPKRVDSVQWSPLRKRRCRVTEWRMPERVFLRQTRATIRPNRISWVGGTFMVIDAVWGKAINERSAR